MRDFDVFGGGRAFDAASEPLAPAKIGPSGPQEVNEPSDVIPGNTSTTFSLTINGASETGAVNVAGDDDWFRVDLVAGQNYVFSMVSNGASPVADTFLELHDSTGALIAVDDDGGNDTNSLMRFTAVTTGTYYLNARAWEPDGGATLTGTYTVSAATGAAQDPLDTIELEYTFPDNTISVYFATAGQTWNGDQAVRSWTASEISAVMTALGTFSAVTPLVFTQSNTSAGADFILTLANLEPNVLGHFFAGQGFGAFSPSVSGWNTAGLQPGGSAFNTVIHEIGHGLGLGHPHLDGQDVQVMQGVIDQFNSYGTFQLNQGVFTMMSYNDGWPLGTNHASPSTAYGANSTPGPLDIALLQEKYGVNPNTGAGDTTYIVSAANTGYRAIWDVGGADTISYLGTAQSTIDLRAATLLNAVGGGGYVTFVTGIQGGITIAHGVTIENASGGTAADTINGNEIANRLLGNNGNDTLNGNEGDDTLIGGVGNDNLNGGDGSDTASYETATALVIASLTAPNTNTGHALNDSYTSVENLRGTGFNDTLTGDGNANFLWGGDGADTLTGGAGADGLDGGNGDDILYADSSDIGASVLGGAGSDLLIFTSGPAPTQINLIANGIEAAEGRFTDTQGAAWTTQTDYYTTSWALDLTSVTNDDGTRSTLDFDQASAFTWATSYVAFDTLNRADVDVTTYDDNSHAVLDYDQGTAFNWTTTWASYTPSDALDTDVITYDDNSHAVRDFDQGNAFNWEVTWASYTTTGVLDIDIFTYDDGSTAVRDLDQDDSFTWETTWASYDNLGRLDTDVVTYDDGTYAVRDLDQADAFSWSEQWWLYDINGNVIAHTETPDGP